MPTSSLLTALFSLGLAHAEGANKEVTEVPASAIVTAVYDGDTVTLDTGDKVRLRWVNTPELRPAEDYGIEARTAARLLLEGKRVSLIYGATTRDGYGRLIAGIRTAESDLSIHLLEQGLGHVFIIPPDDTDPAPLLEAQERARQARRGIWSTERYAGDLHITSFHANAPGDDRENVNGEYLRVCNVSSADVDLNGYRISDITGTSWTFPSLVVPAGHTVQVHSGMGEHQTDPGAQLAVFLGSEAPVWNNNRDRATIYNRHGQIVDVRLHEPKSRN
jgi:endonuclease YncB( thermonuclease family)